MRNRRVNSAIPVQVLPIGALNTLRGSCNQHVNLKEGKRLRVCVCLFHLLKTCSEPETDRPGSNRRGLTFFVVFFFFNFTDLLFFSFFFFKEHKRLSKLAQNSLVNGPLEVSCNLLVLLMLASSSASSICDLSLLFFGLIRCFVF